MSVEPMSCVAKPTVERVKRFGQWLPYTPDIEGALEADVYLMSKARKKESTLFAGYALACTDPVMGPKRQYLYLSSLACLRAKMLEANGRVPFARRLSLHQIMTASQQYKILINLGEPVSVYKVPKDSGLAWRTIHDFGLVARGAQRMANAVLRETFTPAPFQYTSLGVHAAIHEALRLITQEGYSWVSELDINSHYQSFVIESLVESLPLPKGAVTQIVGATSANWVMGNTSPYSFIHHTHPTPSGIPAGSATSTAVAEWSVSHLAFDEATDIALVNYADNFFLFDKSSAALVNALEALRAAIKALPGGVFNTHPIAGAPGSIRHVAAGFGMLGCKVYSSEGGLLVEPSETSLKELEGRFWLEEQVVVQWLRSAELTQEQELRREGVRAFLALRSYVQSWLAAHSMCTDIDIIGQEYTWQLSSIRGDFQLSDVELVGEEDPSTCAKYYPSSTRMGA